MTTIIAGFGLAATPSCSPYHCARPRLLARSRLLRQRQRQQGAGPEDPCDRTLTLVVCTEVAVSADVGGPSSQTSAGHPLIPQGRRPVRRVCPSPRSRACKCASGDQMFASCSTEVVTVDGFMNEMRLDAGLSKRWQRSACRRAGDIAQGVARGDFRTRGPSLDE